MGAIKLLVFIHFQNMKPIIANVFSLCIGKINFIVKFSIDKNIFGEKNRFFFLGFHIDNIFL
jgi:hypothetical protein